MFSSYRSQSFEQRLINSLTTKKAEDKIFGCKFSKNVSPRFIILIIHRAHSVDLDEVAHSEPLHQQDLCCLQIQLFSSLVLKELKQVSFCLTTLSVDQTIYIQNVLYFSIWHTALKVPRSFNDKCQKKTILKHRYSAFYAWFSRKKVSAPRCTSRFCGNPRTLIH